MLSYMRALKDGGVLSVTLWNKEEPPKSVLKLYATMVQAAQGVESESKGADPKNSVADEFYAVSSYLSTATVLYKRGGFSADDIAKLHEHTKAMSFDELTYPGFEFDATQTAATLKSYREGIFGVDAATASANTANAAKSPDANVASKPAAAPTTEPTTAPAVDPTAPAEPSAAPAADPTAPA